MRLHIERKFCAAHSLGDFLGQEEAERVYGKCTHLHGHTWEVVVDLCGPVNQYGMVVNFSEVKTVIDKLDHHLINNFVKTPTAENLVQYFLDRLVEKFSFLDEIDVQVWESDTAYAEDSWTSPTKV